MKNGTLLYSPNRAERPLTSGPHDAQERHLLFPAAALLAALAPVVIVPLLGVSIMCASTSLALADPADERRLECLSSNAARRCPLESSAYLAQTDAPLPARAQRALTGALLLSALRCTIQYVLLPFVLPWIGVAATIPPWLTLALGALALGFLARNVRALWRTRHAQRWSYLMVASLVAASLLVFMLVDVRALVRAL